MQEITVNTQLKADEIARMFHDELPAEYVHGRIKVVLSIEATSWLRKQFYKERASDLRHYQVAGIYRDMSGESLGAWFLETRINGTGVLWVELGMNRVERWIYWHGARRLSCERAYERALDNLYAYFQQVESNPEYATEHDARLVARMFDAAAYARKHGSVVVSNDGKLMIIGH